MGKYCRSWYFICQCVTQITIDDYVAQNKVGKVDLLMIDVEGSEIKV
ncbi:MAG: FkbM family methyltransferase [Chitinophagaceae bacterium]|nr:FkbM family methyltransferase [Chitinophagaceae bacterium]